MWLQTLSRRRTSPPRPAAGRSSLLTTWICIAALGLGTSPTVTSTVVRLTGAPLNEELPAEVHTRAESQQAAGVRPRGKRPFHLRVDGLRATVRRPALNDRELSRISSFVPSPATELIRTGIQLLC